LGRQDVAVAPEKLNAAWTFKELAGLGRASEAGDILQDVRMVAEQEGVDMGEERGGRRARKEMAAEVAVIKKKMAAPGPGPPAATASARPIPPSATRT